MSEKRKQSKGLGALIRGWAGLGSTSKAHDHEEATGWGKPMAVVAEELSIAVEHDVRLPCVALAAPASAHDCLRIRTTWCCVVQNGPK